MAATRVEPKGSIFINCPYRKEYQRLLEAQIFTIHALGYVAESALVSNESTRIDRLCKMIRGADRSIHDLSLAGEVINGLPRLNVPFEIGLWMGLRGFCARKSSPCLIFVDDPQAYQSFLSDINGLDFVRAHSNDAEEIIREIRLWIAQGSPAQALPSPRQLTNLWSQYKVALPRVHDEMIVFGAKPTHTFAEYRYVISESVSTNISLSREAESR